MASENETGELVAKRLFIVTMVGCGLYTAACFLIGW